MSRMSNREEFRQKLREVSGYSYFYFDPPESVKMKYPCIIYKRDKLDRMDADNTLYGLNVKYQVTVVDKDPDNGAGIDEQGNPNESVIEKLLYGFQKIKHERHYVVDNLHHDVFSIYF